jgi:hypothetical protein
MKKVTWVKKPHNFFGISALYVNIETGEKIQESDNGSCFVFNSTKPASKPLEFIAPKMFDRWDFWPGSNYDEIPTIGNYCCDGDGFVVVELMVDGTIRLLDQGVYMLDLSDDIDQAMSQATQYVFEQWPDIYEARLLVESD